MTKNHSKQLTLQHSLVEREKRHARNKHRGAVVWFTGLSGAGKSTLAYALEANLFNLGCSTYVLDGDNLRYGLCQDLGFSNQDRTENIRRVGELSKLMLDAGLIVMSAFISPLVEDREKVRQLVGEDHFIEVYCNTPIEACEARDVKGLYKRARAGELADFTGVSSPYEIPVNADLTLNSDEHTLEHALEILIELLIARGVLPSTHLS